MYPDELRKFIEDRNYYIGGDDLTLVTSIEKNPQLRIINYNPLSNIYEMWDVYNNYYSFYAMPYKEAVEKNLVKKRD